MMHARGELRGVRIVLGSEGDEAGAAANGLDLLSLVSASYALPGRANAGVAGSVAVLGPTRMDYPALVPIVNETARAMGEFLGRAESDDD